MITGKEPIYPILKNRQEWEDRSDGDSLGLGHYTVGGLELKQHMMIEFGKALISSCDWNKTILNTQLMEITASKALELTNIFIKQLNEDETT